MVLSCRGAAVTTGRRVVAARATQQRSRPPDVLVDLSLSLCVRHRTLYANLLTGTIPAELSTMTSMGILQLYSNSLTGTIPVELSTMTSIEILQLYSNSLTGTIPVELSTMTSMSIL